MPPRRILILSLEYTPQVSGGVGTHAQELAQALQAKGCSVTVIACSPDATRTYFDGSVEVHLLGMTMGARQRRSIVEGILAMNREMEALALRLYAGSGLRPDVIQCYNWVTYRAARSVSSRFDIPSISTIQYISEPVERWWGQKPDPAIVDEERFVFTDAQRFITVSASMRDVIARTHGVDDRRLHVIHNALDPTPFARDVPAQHVTALRRTIAPDSGKVVLFAGRLNPQKGVVALLESACLVAASLPGVRYVFAGEPDSEEFGRLAASVTSRYPQLAGRIVLLGKVSRAMLPLLYKAADVAVVPSVYEPFGYAAIEAMAAGTPLVVSRAGGLSEIVEHEKTGLHVTVHDGPDGQRHVDVQELAAMQLRLLNDNTLGRKMAAAAQEAVVDRFHRDHMAAATLDVYAQLCATRSCPAV